MKLLNALTSLVMLPFKEDKALQWGHVKRYLGVGHPDLRYYLQREPEVRAFVEERLAKGGLFVDVGANVGAYSVLAAKGGMDVVAFEPQPWCRKMLEKNTRGLPVSVYPFALGSAAGEAHIQEWYTGDFTGEVRTLDSFDLAPALVKVDVEGMELQVLLGAASTLERKHPDLTVEIHGPDQAEIRKLLADLGYSVKESPRHWFATRLVP